MTEHDVEIGRKIAAHRVRKGLSQKEFAPLIDRSETWLSQVERGIRAVKALDVLERIAAVLDIPLAELAPNAPAVAAEQVPSEAVPLRSLLSANFGLRALIDASSGLVADTDSLESGTEQAWTLAHEAKYEELISLLEVLLPRLESAAATATDPRSAFAQLARCYHACAAALAKLRQYDAAWVAADRAISDAARASDPLLMGEGAFRLTLIFQGANQLDQAEHTAATAQAALSELAAQGAPEALSVFGALTLQLAIIAARTDRTEEARRFIEQARVAATRLGRDRNDYHTEFGPTNVQLHEVAVAVELGDAGEAIRIAAGIDASRLSAERQGRLAIDVARAWTQRRNVDRALSALETAESVTPEQVRSHSLVHSSVRDLMRINSSAGPALADFARRIGMDV
ncbi:helix-turn-helix domain-containing protein [Nocardia sp. NPDC005366]|uniref:helix-turn-helix domain-containing protein n=1 Tax=Nocardia sp. NPDC005366 TaxID=3156878 RepID=UPI0033AF6CEB